MSILGLAPLMQLIADQSPRKSDSRATAPAPTCPDGRSQKDIWKYGEGQVNRETVSISCNNLPNHGICQKHSERRQRQTPHRERRETQDRTWPRRWHPTWRGGMPSPPPLPERNAEVTDKRAHKPSSDTEGEANSVCPETAKQQHELTPDTARKGKRKAKVPTPPLRHAVLSATQGS